MSGNTLHRSDERLRLQIHIMDILERLYAVRGAVVTCGALGEHLLMEGAGVNMDSVAFNTELTLALEQMRDDDWFIYVEGDGVASPSAIISINHEVPCTLRVLQ